MRSCHSENSESLEYRERPMPKGCHRKRFNSDNPSIFEVLNILQLEELTWMAGKSVGFEVAAVFGTFSAFCFGGILRYLQPSVLRFMSGRGVRKT